MKQRPPFRLDPDFAAQIMMTYTATADLTGTDKTLHSALAYIRPLIGKAVQHSNRIRCARLPALSQCLGQEGTVPLRVSDEARDCLRMHGTLPAHLYQCLCSGCPNKGLGIAEEVGDRICLLGRSVAHGPEQFRSFLAHIWIFVLEEAC
mmetsp:Transcript_13442/g.27988  ORF Transcript_13442/g.27988 Transcript_13442/m.27988 type:complete len:149 (-) Transcript_13442:164-610(-)